MPHLAKSIKPCDKMKEILIFSKCSEIILLLVANILMSQQLVLELSH